MILEPPKIKSDTVSIVFPSIVNEVIGPDAMILFYWVLSFEPTFYLSFTLPKAIDIIKEYKIRKGSKL